MPPTAILRTQTERERAAVLMSSSQYRRPTINAAMNNFISPISCYIVHLILPTRCRLHAATVGGQAVARGSCRLQEGQGVWESPAWSRSRAPVGGQCQVRGKTRLAYLTTLAYLLCGGLLCLSNCDFRSIFR